MASKCLPEYLLIASQLSTCAGRGLRFESRGLVGTWVEGCISLTRFIEARDRAFCRGCRYLYSNCHKGKRKLGIKKEKMRIEITIGPSIYTLYFRNRSDWPQWRAAGMRIKTSRRHDRRVADEGERPAEEAWAESERLQEARRREENRAARGDEYHQEQAERHRAVERHQDRCYQEPQLRGG
jgi:hypothetical protein